MSPAMRVEQQSGRRTISLEDVRPAVGNFTREQEAAWAKLKQLGLEVGWPAPGRPSKAMRAASWPRLKDLGLTKQQVYRWREMAGIDVKARFQELRREGRKISHEAVVGRYRPRRRAERLIDDLRRSLPFFSHDEVQRLLDVLAALLEAREQFPEEIQRRVQELDELEQGLKELVERSTR